MSIEPRLHPAERNKEVPRILIVRVGAMGDVLHALHAVTALREALPHAHIGWAIAPQWAPLLRAGEPPGRHAERMPLIDELHAVESKLWNRNPLSRTTLHSIGTLRESLRAAKYDLAIDLQGTLRSAAIARVGGAAPTFGSDTPREGPARLFYNHRVPTTQAHVVDHAHAIVGAALHWLGNSAPPSAHEDPVLPRDPNADAWWQQQAEQRCDERPCILLAATAGWGAKEWPPEKFAALAAALAQRDYCVLLNTTPGSVDAVTSKVLEFVRTQYAAAAAHVHALGCTIPQLIAATRTMHAVIAGDTGPLHLAAALGVPTVGLFGPTAPERTGPQNRRSINLRDPQSVTDHRRHAETEPGLARIPVEAVLAALDGVLEESHQVR